MFSPGQKAHGQKPCPAAQVLRRFLESTWSRSHGLNHMVYMNSMTLNDIEDSELDKNF